MRIKPLNEWIKKTFNEIPLRTVLIVPFVLQILGVVGIVGYLSYRSGQEAVEELTNALMTEIGDRITQNLDHYLHTSDEIAQINAKAIRLGLLDWQNKSKLEDYFIAQINTFSEISSVYIATEQEDFFVVAKSQPDSLVIREWNRRTGDLENYVADLQGNRLYLRDILPNYRPHKDPPDKPWYPIAKAAKNGTWETVVSFVKKPSLILVLVRSLPFYDSQGNVMGVVGATVFLDQMGEFLRQLEIGKTGQAFIIDRGGYLIATSTDELPFYQGSVLPKMQALNLQQWRLSAEDSRNPVTQAMGKYLMGEFGNLESIERPLELRIKQQKQYYYVRVIPYSLNNKNDWFIVVTIPESDFIAEIKANINRTILLCMAALLLTILISIATAKGIVKAVNKLRLAAQKLAQNNFDLPLEKTRIREVNQLTDSFNRMAEQLNLSFQTLQVSEKRFSVLLDSVPIGVSVFDQNGQHILINKLGEQILGQGIKTIPAEQLSEVYRVYKTGTNQLYPIEELPGLLALKGEKIHVEDMEIEINNYRIPLEVTSIPVFDESGTVIYSINMFQDVTERRQNEQLRSNYQQQLEREIAERTLALQKSEERFRLALDNAPDVVVLYDKNRRFLYVNNHAQQRTGWPLEYFIGRRDEDLFPEEVTRQYLPLLKKTYAEKTAQTGEYTIQLPGQEPHTIIVKYSPILDDQGNIREVIATTLDISDRKRAEELLSQSKARYLSILEYQTEFITRCQPDGRLNYVNDAYCRYFGISKENFIGYRYQPIIYPEDQPAIDSCLAQLSPEQPVFNIENRVIVNGEVRWTQWTNQAIYDTEGNIVELQSVGRDIHDRKRAEIALQKTSQQLQAFLDNAPTIIHLFDAEERYLRVNPAFTKLFNLPEEQIIGRTFSDFFPEDLLKIWRTRIEQIVGSGKPKIVEDEVVINGELKLFESTLFPVMDESGKPTTFGAIVTDITDRKRTELELRKSRDLRDAIFHESADALFLVDVDTILTIDCNRRAVELFEAQNREELIGIAGHTLQKRQFAPQELTDLREEVNQKGFWSIETEYITKKGRCFWGNLAVKPIYVGGKLIHLVRVTDISDRKFAEQALRESEKQLRLLADALPVFISYADCQERYQFVNRKYEEQFGMSREEICGKTTREVIGEVSYNLVREYIKQALAGESVSYEVTVTGAKTSEDCHLSVMLIPDFNEQFSVRGYYSLIIDITDRKRMELELQKAKDAAEAASQAKGAFIANMSHELRSPLNAILGFASLLKNDPELSSEKRKNSDIIYRSGEHLLKLINQILDFAKIEANKTIFEPNDFNFDRLIEDIYGMFCLKAESKKLHLNVQKTSDVPRYIRTDEMKLRQVLINLLSNAFKFTKRGYIALRVFVESESSDNNVMLNFEVEDTGIGIAPEEQTHLFEAFNQTEYGRKIKEGTGLGLTISREFVQLMGGHITLESQPNVGSTFRFNIAAKIVGAVQTSSATDTQEIIGLAPEQPCYRLLVVDDNFANRRLLVQLLTPLGFAVQEAENGAEAITLWQQWQPDLIWMDLRMPVADGYQATRQIRDREQSQNTNNPVIIIAISANPLSENCQTLGFNDFVHKPFQELEILTALQQHLGVEYRHAKTVPEHPQEVTNLDDWADAIANLADSTLKELEEALIFGNPQLIQQTIQSLEKQNPQLAAVLIQCANQFEYARILDSIHSVR